MLGARLGVQDVHTKNDMAYIVSALKGFMCTPKGGCVQIWAYPRVLAGKCLSVEHICGWQT